MLDVLDTLSRTGRQHSADDVTTAPSLDALIRGPSLGRRVARAVLRFLVVFCIGVAATLAWQSYGDAARAMIAASWPQLAWLAPEAAPAAPTASDTVAAAAAVTPSPELQQLREELQQLSSAFTGVRQRVDQLAAGQQQIAGDIAKTATRQQELLHKLASQPRPAAAPKPVTLPSSEPR